MGYRTDRKRFCRFCGKRLDDNYFFCNDSCAQAFEQEYDEIDSILEEFERERRYKNIYKPV